MELNEIASRALRLDAVRETLNKPRGIFRKRCPKCNSRLTKEEANDPHLMFRLWHCLCGYEFGRVSDF